MQNNLIQWAIKPFATKPTLNGYVGDRIYTESFLGLAHQVDFNMIRSLGVSNSLGLRQSDYWVESASDTLVLSQPLAHDKQRPLTVSTVAAFTDSVAVAGGKPLVGQAVYDGVAEGIILAGQTLYIKSDGNLVATDATDAVKSSVAAVAYSSGGGSPSGPISFIVDGEINLSDWTSVVGSTLLTPGAVYYLDPSAVGLMTSTAPSASGQYAVKVGRAISTTNFALELGEGVGL